METLGYIGSIMLAICGLPQAIESFKTKSSEGLTWGFIGLWFWGEIFTFAYILPKMDLPLLINYSANIIFLSVIIYFKLFPKNKL
jgi:uncharacterized protein with PQ loop repeat